MIKIPATSGDKVTIIGQMHHWFISQRQCEYNRDNQSDPLKTWLLSASKQLTFCFICLVFKYCQCFLVGWLAFSKFERQEIHRQNGKTNIRMLGI